ncbi:NADH dehydrogenase subunit K [Pyrobaculum islandicum DSM 4184]|uniref:NADH dehydrogenase subunit K n=1 Tax=Pyrobaculum islandicum (strain DSM 4184 / JCM 9189 / GEO3) TaxID=384616 RepID=A1RV00_PYRIL|nr:NADH-quinone oxidoreductase subunit K [Pyrobaculum islandicum]ABL88782.1 NADH dehydrogenase subunit K [Pyrobaculum islandicum DSM 4184]
MNAAFVVGFILILLGLYSIAITRNLVRILISLELATVGAFLILTPIVLKNSILAFYGVLILVMISVSEASILAALIYRNYILTRETDISAMKSGREI